MKKNLTKIILTIALTIFIAGTTTTVAKAHHSHSSNTTAQNTSGYQGGHCHDNEYCGINQTCVDGGYYDTNQSSNAGYIEKRRHHADFYCGSRSEYYSRRGNRINCHY